VTEVDGVDGASESYLTPYKSQQSTVYEKIDEGYHETEGKRAPAARARLTPHTWRCLKSIFTQTQAARMLMEYQKSRNSR